MERPSMESTPGVVMTTKHDTDVYVSSPFGALDSGQLLVTPTLDEVQEAKQSGQAIGLVIAAELYVDKSELEQIDLQHVYGQVVPAKLRAQVVLCKVLKVRVHDRDAGHFQFLVYTQSYRPLGWMDWTTALLRLLRFHKHWIDVAEGDAYVSPSPRWKGSHIIYA